MITHEQTISIEGRVIPTGTVKVTVLDLDHMLEEMGTGDRVVLERQENRDFRIVGLRPRVRKVDQNKRGRPATPINLDLVAMMQEEGYSIRQIAKKVNCSHTTLLARLKREGRRNGNA